MNYQSLGQLWNEFIKHGNQIAEEALKLRYVGWDHKTRFFSPQTLDEDKGQVSGVLDCGELISFPVESAFWVKYNDGMENEAKAV
jgi:hypothetical protein